MDTIQKKEVEQIYEDLNRVLRNYKQHTDEEDKKLLEASYILLEFID